MAGVLDQTVKASGWCFGLDCQSRGTVTGRQQQRQWGTNLEMNNTILFVSTCQYWSSLKCKVLIVCNFHWPQQLGEICEATKNRGNGVLKHSSQRTGMWTDKYMWRYINHSLFNDAESLSLAQQHIRTSPTPSRKLLVSPLAKRGRNRVTRTTFKLKTGPGSLHYW